MSGLPGPLSAGIKIIKTGRDNQDLEIDATQFIQDLSYILQMLFEAASPGWEVTNKTEDRTLDCDSNDPLVLGDVLGTLIDDLITKGILDPPTPSEL